MAYITKNLNNLWVWTNPNLPFGNWVMHDNTVHHFTPLFIKLLQTFIRRCVMQTTNEYFSEIFILEIGTWQLIFTKLLVLELWNASLCRLLVCLSGLTVMFFYAKYHDLSLKWIAISNQWVTAVQLWYQKMKINCLHGIESSKEASGCQTPLIGCYTGVIVCTHKHGCWWTKASIEHKSYVDQNYLN